VLHRKWYVDELYDRAVIGPFHGLSRGCARTDPWVVDGAVNGVAGLTPWLSYLKASIDKWAVDLLVNAIGWLIGAGGAIMRRLQAGYVQSYAAVIVFGTLALLATYLFFFTS
jgi:NADH:ubiquinone oxidoreductase subunit 5 (subunit L)/multisubunit Na+/H+ antiporter MnhA subunit